MKIKMNIKRMVVGLMAGYHLLRMCRFIGRFDRTAHIRQIL